MSGSQYYDDLSYSRILKGISTVKRLSDSADISYNHSSIIYTYDPDWTPIARVGSEYYNVIDVTYRTLKNQLLSISGELITTGHGKNVDVSLNIYNDGEVTQDVSNVNISGISFIGNYSNQTINGEPMNVLDLFKYSFLGYTITTTNLEPNIEYLTKYDDLTNSYSYTLQVSPYSTTYFSYDDISGVWYISNPLSDPRTLCSDPIEQYGLSRQELYSYPNINVNNILSERTSYDTITYTFTPNIITEKIDLPSL